MPPTPMATGWAAPMLVPGAMAAIWEAKVMKTPAEAALAPLGETYTTTGTWLFIIALTIWRIDLSSPPGVSSFITRHWAFSWEATFKALSRRSAATGLIGPSSRKTCTTLFSSPIAEQTKRKIKENTVIAIDPRFLVIKLSLGLSFWLPLAILFYPILSGLLLFYFFWTEPLFYLRRRLR